MEFQDLQESELTALALTCTGEERMLQFGNNAAVLAARA